MMFHASIFGQRHDNNWIIGYDLESNASLSETMLVSFNSSPPSIVNWPVALDFNTTTLTVSDAEGNLIFFTNGIQIHDASDNLMLGGDSLNAGQLAYENWDNGYPAFEGIQALPTGNDIYFLFHVRGEWETEPVVPELLFTVVDMKLNGGHGEVIQKNQLVKIGQNYEFPAATRHANGRDWWVVSPELYQNKIFTCLVTPYGVADTTTQTIGYKPPAPDSIGVGQNFFSPDGTTYVDLDFLNGVRIYDFDRCTGMLSNFRQIPASIAPKTLGGAISPNSRYLYITADDAYLVLQFDLQANDIAASMDTVAVYDGFMQGPFESIFTFMRLAPDGKIYINTNTRHFHVINSPDTKGLDCDVRQHYLPLPQEPLLIPVYPNYRLGPIDGSPCDTLGLDVAAGEEQAPEEETSNFSIAPNPAQELLNLTGQVPLHGDTTWELFNSLGGNAMKIRLPPGSQHQTIALHGLAVGIYYYKVASDGKTVQSGKLIIN